MKINYTSALFLAIISKQVMRTLKLVENQVIHICQCIADMFCVSYVLNWRLKPRVGAGMDMFLGRHTELSCPLAQQDDTLNQIKFHAGLKLTFIISTS
jgi:hypothetical protein